MNKWVGTVKAESGFSLLESVTSIYLLLLFIATAVPIWSAIHQREQIAEKMVIASELAVEQIERSHGTGSVRTGKWTIDQASGQYLIAVRVSNESAGRNIRVQVSFAERGNNHVVSYDTIVP